MTQGWGHRWQVALGIAALGLVASNAFAQAAPKGTALLPVRTAQIELENKEVKFSVSWKDIVDAEVAKKLQSGLPTVIVARGYLFKEGGKDPMALTVRSCRIVYDLWDEIYRIQLMQPGGESNVVAVNVEGVLRQCGEAKKVTILDRAAFSNKDKYSIAVLVEVNPMSDETLEKIKRWVTRPNGNSAIGPGDSLFGSFVGLFVTRVESADRRLAFKTQLFGPP